MPRRGKRGPPDRKPPVPVTRGLRELERFSHADLRAWSRVSGYLDELHTLLYAGPEADRIAHRQPILDSLRSQRGPAVSGDIWTRIVDFEFADDPLSPAGSLRSVGGRFNVGADLRAAGFEPWPVLYLAQDYDTAYRERFILPPNGSAGALKPHELALRKPSSFANVNVRVRMDSVFDLTRADVLRPLIDIIGKFRLPPRVAELSRLLKLKRGAVHLVRSASELHRVIMSPDWRLWPAQFDLPSQSQLLGRYIADAGFEAIRFRSSKGAGDCLAVICRNLADSDAFVELSDTPHSGMRCIRLDRSNARAL